MEFKPALSVGLALQSPCVTYLPRFPCKYPSAYIAWVCCNKQTICVMNILIVKLNTSEIINQPNSELKVQGLPEDPNFHVKIS